jgi:hypothetical protein
VNRKYLIGSIACELCVADQEPVGGAAHVCRWRAAVAAQGDVAPFGVGGVGVVKGQCRVGVHADRALRQHVSAHRAADSAAVHQCATGVADILSGGRSLGECLPVAGLATQENIGAGKSLEGGGAVAEF